MASRGSITETVNIARDLEQLLLRIGVGYNLTENNNNIFLGYGFINSQNYVLKCRWKARYRWT